MVISVTATVNLNHSALPSHLHYSTARNAVLQYKTPGTFSAEQTNNQAVYYGYYYSASCLSSVTNRCCKNGAIKTVQHAKHNLQRSQMNLLVLRKLLAS